MVKTLGETKNWDISSTFRIWRARINQAWIIQRAFTYCADSLNGLQVLFWQFFANQRRHDGEMDVNCSFLGKCSRCVLHSPRITKL